MMPKASFGGEASKKKCICKKKGREKALWVKCQRTDCEIGWWHATCAGFIQAKQPEITAVGEWLCPACVMKNYKNDINEENFKNDTLIQLKSFTEEIKKEISEIKSDLHVVKNQNTKSWADVAAAGTSNKLDITDLAKQVANNQKQMSVDRCERENNIMIFNVQEDDKPNSDHLFFESLSEALELEKCPEIKTARIGAQSMKHPRPVKACFTNLWEKENFFRNYLN